MKLSHLNLTVTDVPEARRFLMRYFGLQDRGGNRQVAVLSDDDGLLLSLSSRKIGRGSEARYPATFHIGFIQESEEQVNEINQRLRENGFDVPPPSRQHGSWSFSFAAPGGCTIEVLC